MGARKNIYIRSKVVRDWLASQENVSASVERLVLKEIETSDEKDAIVSILKTQVLIRADVARVLKALQGKETKDEPVR